MQVKAPTFHVHVTQDVNVENEREFVEIKNTLLFHFRLAVP